MRLFFVDAFYWIALLSPRDQWHERVLAFDAMLDAYHLYTTDEVLTEFLALYSTANPTIRTRAVTFVRAILDDEDITVIPQTRAGFLLRLSGRGPADAPGAAPIPSPWWFYNLSR